MKTIKTLAIGAALAALTLTASAQSFLTNGLVAYYPLNGNANDESGHGNDGVVTGAALGTNRFGIFSNSYAFKATGPCCTWVGDYITTTKSKRYPLFIPGRHFARVDHGLRNR